MYQVIPFRFTEVGNNPKTNSLTMKTLESKRG